MQIISIKKITKPLIVKNILLIVKYYYFKYY